MNSSKDQLVFRRPFLLSKIRKLVKIKFIMEEKIFMQKQQIQMNLLFLLNVQLKHCCHDVSVTFSKCFMGNYALRVSKPLLLFSNLKNHFFSYCCTFG